MSSTAVAEKSTLEPLVMSHHRRHSLLEKVLPGNSPKKGPKCHTSLQRPTEIVTSTGRHANQHRQRDEAGEPEKRGHGIHGQDRELVTDVSSLIVVAWGEYEEGDGEDGPDGAKDQEVDLARGCVVVRVEEPIVAVVRAVVFARDYVEADVIHWEERARFKGAGVG